MRTRRIENLFILMSFKRILRRKKLVVFAVLILVFVIFLHTDMSPDLYFIHWGRLEDISCYHIETGDALPPVEKNSRFPSKSIYFHETSCRGQLNSRQACTVESVARAHPYWQINVLFSGPVSEMNLNNGSLNALKLLPNVFLFRLHLLQFVKGTPLEDMVRGGALNRTRWRIESASDMLRYVTLYKWGGVYLDLDQVTAKSFEDLGSNWAARESEKSLASSVLAFSMDSLGRFVANATISDLKVNYRGDEWGRIGPGVITRVLQKMCNTKYVNEMSAERCNGFQVYGPELFSPIHFRQAQRYFDSEDLKVGDPYAYHVWNKLTANKHVPKNSFYSRLSQKYCPSIYKLYGVKFGL